MYVTLIPKEKNINKKPIKDTSTSIKDGEKIVHEACQGFSIGNDW